MSNLTKLNQKEFCIKFLFFNNPLFYLKRSCSGIKFKSINVSLSNLRLHYEPLSRSIDRSCEKLSQLERKPCDMVYALHLKPFITHSLQGPQERGNFLTLPTNHKQYAPSAPVSVCVNTGNLSDCDFSLRPRPATGCT